MVLKMPITFYNWIGLGDIISPLRLRGVEGVLNRMKRQMKEYLETQSG
jgi:sulfur transfer protein SufE